MSDKNKIKVPAKMTAIAAGTSVELVNKARAGKRVKGRQAKKVLHADELLGQGINKLLEEVKQVVNF